MPVTWDPIRWWGWCVQEDEKKTFLIAKQQYKVAGATKINMLINYQLVICAGT